MHQCCRPVDCGAQPPVATQDMVIDDGLVGLGDHIHACPFPTISTGDHPIHARIIKTLKPIGSSVDSMGLQGVGLRTGPFHSRGVADPYR
jgi:hypothetical protein